MMQVKLLTSASFTHSYVRSSITSTKQHTQCLCWNDFSSNYLQPRL